MALDQNTTLPTLVKFRPFIDVISVLFCSLEYQYYLCFCFKLFVFDVVGSWFYQTEFSKPVGHFNQELGPQFSSCTHIVSHPVANILPILADPTMYLSRKWKISIVSHVWTSIISCMYIVSLHWFKELKMFSIFWILSWSSWRKICLFFWTNYVILLLPHVHPHAFAATKDRLPDLLPPPFTNILLSYFIALAKVTLNYLTLLCHLKTL